MRSVRSRPVLFAVIAMVTALGCGLGVVGSGYGTAPAEDGGGKNAPPDMITDGSTIDDSAQGFPFDAPPPTTHAQSALSFHGNQYVNCATIPIPSDFTLEAWVRPASRGAEMMIAAEDRDLNKDNQFRLGLTTSGALYFMTSDESQLDHGLFSVEAGTFALQSSPLPLGAWTHVAVTKQGATFRLLVDAAVVATFDAQTAAFPRNATFAFRIAARMGNGGPSNYFDGAVDDLRLFSVARSDVEIASDRNTELDPAGPSFASLVAYWRFDENGGNLAHDDKGGFNGALVANPTWIPSGAF